MMAKPMEISEMQYAMIQFLSMRFIIWMTTTGIGEKR